MSKIKTHYTNFKEKLYQKYFIKTLFTDLQMLEVIYKTHDSYYKQNANSNVEDSSLVIIFPIDLDIVVSKLNSDKHHILNRLKNMNNLYNQKVLTENPLSNDYYQINFSNICSILAQLRDQNKEIRSANIKSWISIIIAITSAVIAYKGL